MHPQLPPTAMRLTHQVEAPWPCNWRPPGLGNGWGLTDSGRKGGAGMAAPASVVQLQRTLQHRDVKLYAGDVGGECARYPLLMMSRLSGTASRTIALRDVSSYGTITPGALR